LDSPYQISHLYCHQKITILDPIQPLERNGIKEKSEEFANRVRTMMARQMKLPFNNITNHSYADVRLHIYSYVKKKRLPPLTFTAVDCKNILNLSVEEIEKAIDEYMKGIDMVNQVGNGSGNKILDWERDSGNEEQIKNWNECFAKMVEEAGEKKRKGNS